MQLSRPSPAWLDALAIDQDRRRAQPSQLERARADREHILARYDNGALPPGIAAVVADLDRRIEGGRA